MDLTALGGPEGGTGVGGHGVARNRATGTQKNELKSWLKVQWCLPPEANAEFVCWMENVLEVYQRPYDDTHPLIGMDETSKQLVREVRSPLPSQPGKPEK